ncbi:MAG: NADP-dependent oxidoreductase [Propionibacterium sp.]|nr:NADP-dependent oxidoreductase [Propionibacterium sp.]
MRQVTIHEFGSPAVLKIEEVAEPALLPGEVLVDVHYAGLNPLDYKIRDGSSGMAAKLTLPSSLGREFVGKILTAAPDVDLAAHDLREGQWVFGMRAHPDVRGTYAERISVSVDSVAPVLDDSSLPHYAGLALVGLTALDAIEQAAIAQGDTVLIHGGSGGVGQLLIPLALQRGASQVWATGRAANAERIRELGATPIPYDGVNWQEVIADETEGRGVDSVIDTHYFRTFLPSLNHVADGGRIVALPSLADLTPAKERGIDASVPGIAPTREKLDWLARAFDAGELPLEVSEVLPMDEVASGHKQLESGHTRGKLILDVRA